MLTIQTQIPTIARGAVRALVKAHPDWIAFITAKGKLSAQALNADLLEFAVKYPALAAQIENVLSMSHLDVNEIIVCDAQDIRDAMDDNYTPVTPLAAATTCKIAEAADKVAASFDLDTIFSGVDQFLAPLVRDTLSKALGPVITAANKPAVEVERIVEVEVERIVEVEAGSAPRPVAGPKARRDKRVTVRTLWPTKKKDAILDKSVTLWTGVPTEPIDPFYVVDHLHMAILATAVERGVNSWFWGPSGTGKSTIAKMFCATVGRPFVRIGMTRQTEIETLVGGMALRNGATVWEDGVLTKAMRQPGTVILIDELTFAPAGVQAIIQNVADEHRMLTLPTGEVVRAADGVVFVVADNTAGFGDEGGLYAGTNVSNVACVNRFGRMIFMDYLSAQKEAEAVANHTACPIGAAKHLAEFVAQARRLPALAGVIISIRQMIAFVACVQDGLSSKEAFNISISSRMPATERAAIETLATLSWATEFEALVNGAPVPASPSDSAASNAFADEQFGN